MNLSPLPHNPLGQKGFGLLEALVALVLLSSVGFTLLAWVHQNLDATHRMRTFYAQQEARRIALEWVRSENPMEKPEGEILYHSLRIKWKAQAQSPSIAQIGYPQGIGKHEVALYNTTISIFRPGESEPWFTEELTTIGHSRVGSNKPPFG